MLPPQMIATFSFDFGQLIGAEEESGDGDCAAGFGYGVGIGCEKFHRLVDFVFGHGDDVVDETLHVFEVDGADALGAESVGDGARDLVGGELDDFSGAQAGLSVGGEFGFDAEDVDFGLGQLDGRGHAADEASAADRGEDGFDFGQVFENFESDGALSGDDFFVVVGRHDDVAVLGGEFFGFQLGARRCRGLPVRCRHQGRQWPRA